MMDTEIAYRVKVLIGAACLPERRVEEIGDDLRLKEDLGLDSLDLNELLLALEDEFEIDLVGAEEEVESAKTVEQICDIVERVLARD